MLTLIIAAAVGFAVTLITTRDLGAGWGIFCGVAMLLITQMIIGLIIRKKVNNINNKINVNNIKYFYIGFKWIMFYVFNKR